MTSRARAPARWPWCAAGAVAIVCVLARPAGLAAQDRATAPEPLSLDQAMQYALDHYPAVRAALETSAASAAGVRVARAGYLPRLDALWQSNRATANNVFGQLLPQSVLPAMSGPVLPAASSQSVWGSATGALFSWEPVDFGLRAAVVADAQAALSRARADEALTRLEVAGAAGDAFLSVVAAERQAIASRADLDRREVLDRMVRALVDNQLRAGADLSRADAERAAAATRLIRAQAAVAIARATLSRVLGVRAGDLSLSTANLLRGLPPVEAAPTGAAAVHPLAQARKADVDEARAQETVLARTDWPRLFVQSSVFARGSGASPNGSLDGGVDGLGLDRANWAAGVQVVFPNLFDFSSLGARKAAADAAERAQAARYDEAMLTIGGERQTAAAMAQAARAVAANTPVELAAARQAETQARARYEAGLAGIVDVADAQSLLARAEAQDELARVDVWRARLASAVADGDLAPFMRLVQP